MESAYNPQQKPSKTLAAGFPNYRAAVGPPHYYDKIGAMQFSLLALLGLRENNSLLDIGCGSLRAGRLWILYLQSGKYFGIDPATWLIEEGKKENLGNDLLSKKAPTFSSDDDYTLTEFDRQFDYLVAQSVFTHAPREHISRCLGQARAVMHEKSIFAATFFEGGADNCKTEWSGLVRYKESTIYQLTNESGLKCRFLDFPHPAGQRWFILTDPGNSVDVRSLLCGYEFSPEVHLRSLIEQFGGESSSYEDYLNEQLRELRERQGYQN